MGMHRDHDPRFSSPGGLGPVLLLITLGLSSCGPGPNGPASGGRVTIAPNGLTLSLGGTGTLTADARDAAGASLSGTEVTWSSLNASVASVDSTGGVTGNSIGSARVRASAAGAADTVVVLVVDQPCNAIETIQAWHVHLNMWYSDHGPVDPSATVTTSHIVALGATLAPTGPPVGGVVEWTGEFFPSIYAGGSMADTAVQIHEQSEDLISDPTIVATLDGAGPPVPTPGVDGFRLRVNLNNCTFQFFAAPSVHATLSVTEHAVNTLPGPDEGTRTFDMDIPLGLLQDGIEPLGDWRAHPMGPWPVYWSWDSYATLYAPAGQNAYIPSGEFGQLLFGIPPRSGPRGGALGHGRADVYYWISSDTLPPPLPQ